MPMNASPISHKGIFYGDLDGIAPVGLNGLEHIRPGKSMEFLHLLDQDTVRLQPSSASTRRLGLMSRWKSQSRTNFGAISDNPSGIFLSTHINRFSSVRPFQIHIGVYVIVAIPAIP